MTQRTKRSDHNDLCHGWEWEVADIDVLAERVARVALGQYRHVAQILEGSWRAQLQRGPRNMLRMRSKNSS